VQVGHRLAQTSIRISGSPFVGETFKFTFTDVETQKPPSLPVTLTLTCPVEGGSKTLTTPDASGILTFPAPPCFDLWIPNIPYVAKATCNDYADLNFLVPP
jgi:hypothetical protein